jgi:hypothetical protein
VPTQQLRSPLPDELTPAGDLPVGGWCGGSLPLCLLTDDLVRVQVTSERTQLAAPLCSRCEATLFITSK